MVIWWLLLASRNQCCGERRSQQLCLLCDVACAALVARALVTLPLQAWSLLRYSLHLSWAIVPYSGATIFLRRYCTSQPQYASRELQIVRDTNAEKHRLQFTLERQGSAVPSSGCVVKRPRRAPVKALTVYPQKRGTSRISRPYHRKITLSVVSCPPRWVNTLKAINQRARLFSAAVMLRPSMFGVFMVAASTVLHCLLLLTQERCSWCARCC